MEKEDKRRIIIYVVIWLFTTLAAIFGLIEYLNGYGKKGAARQELKPLMESFENSNDVAAIKKRSFGVETDIKLSGKIVITYNASDKKEHVYEYKYVEEDGEKIIKSTYKYNDKYAVDIVKAMINTVYESNGGKGSVFDKYDYETFAKTNIKQGVEIKGGNTVTVKINLKQNIVNNIDGVNLDVKVEPYIEEADLKNMLKALETSGSYRLTKNSITVYVLDLGHSYNIYAENTDTKVADDLYNSLMNVIKVLYSSTYDTILSNNDMLNRNNKTSSYEVILRAGLTNRDEIFNPNSDLIEVIIYK